MRDTIIVHSRLAWRLARGEAAEAHRLGLQALTIELVAARLAGGFLQPIDSDALKNAIKRATATDLGELDGIKALPGFSRAAAATLHKVWTAHLDLAGLAAPADLAARPRLEAIARLEEEVLRHLPPAMRRPADLVAAAMSRLPHAKELFGRISVRGRTEMSPVWRPLLAALAKSMEVRWLAGPRHVPSWLCRYGIAIVEAPREHPQILCESCASPGMRRSKLSDGRVP